MGPGARSARLPGWFSAVFVSLLLLLQPKINAARSVSP
jgi:hypothetical protein